MLKRCNEVAKIGTVACFLALFLGALVCSFFSPELYPQVAHVKMVLAWWMAGGLMIFPLVAAALWLGCAYVILMLRAWRALVARWRMCAKQ
jgi:hypothetical protein